jgi:hypothetical protein
MTEDQKDCMMEIQELMEQIINTIKKHGLEDSYVSCLAVGFLNEETAYYDEEGNMRCNMSLLSSIDCEDEEELDEVLSYCVEAYRMSTEETKEEKDDPGHIDYWLRKMRGDDGALN